MHRLSSNSTSSATRVSVTDQIAGEIKSNLGAVSLFALAICTVTVGVLHSASRAPQPWCQGRELLGTHVRGRGAGTLTIRRDHVGVLGSQGIVVQLTP